MIVAVVISIAALTLAACSSEPTPTPVPVASAGDTVAVHYTGTLDDGSEFDSSRGRQPLEFVVDSGQMIAGFNAAVRGMAVGESKTVRLEASEAYGESDPSRIFEVALSAIPAGTEVGAQLFSATGSSVVVVAIEGDVVTLDGNHRLAGEALTFEIELIELTKP